MLVLIKKPPLSPPLYDIFCANACYYAYHSFASSGNMAKRCERLKLSSQWSMTDCKHCLISIARLADVYPASTLIIDCDSFCYCLCLLNEESLGNERNEITENRKHILVSWLMQLKTESQQLSRLGSSFCCWMFPIQFSAAHKLDANCKGLIYQKTFEWREPSATCYQNVLSIWICSRGYSDLPPRLVASHIRNMDHMQLSSCIPEIMKGQSYSHEFKYPENTQFPTPP